MTARALVRGAVATALLALCLGGIGTISQGVAEPIQAYGGERGLQVVFEQRLKANGTNLADTGKTPAVMRSKVTRTIRDTVAKLPKDGPIAQLMVERLGIREVVIGGEPTHDRLARGPMMVKRGDAANLVTVIAAHRDTHFLFVRDLRQGDELTLQSVTGEVVRYRVTRFETVRWDQFAYPLDPARPLLALATCYPFGGTEYGGPWRRVAWAEQVS